MKVIAILILLVTGCVVDAPFDSENSATQAAAQAPDPTPSFCPTGSTWDPLINDCQTNGGGSGGGGDSGGDGVGVCLNTFCEPLFGNSVCAQSCGYAGASCVPDPTVCYDPGEDPTMCLYGHLPVVDQSKTKT